MICLGRLCFHGDCAHSVVSWLASWLCCPDGLSPPRALTPQLSLPLLPHGPIRLSVCVHVALKPPSLCQTGKCNFWLVRVVAGWADKGRVDLIDNKYAVGSMLPLSLTQIHFIKHQSMKRANHCHMKGWVIPNQIKTKNKTCLQSKSPVGFFANILI